MGAGLERTNIWHPPSFVHTDGRACESCRCLPHTVILRSVRREGVAAKSVFVSYRRVEDEEGDLATKVRRTPASWTSGNPNAFGDNPPLSPNGCRPVFFLTP